MLPNSVRPVRSTTTRLTAVVPLRHLHEAPAVIDTLHVGHHHGRGVRVVAEIIDDVDRADLGLVADACRLIDADPAPVAHCCSNIVVTPMLPDLRDETQRTLRRMQLDETDRVKTTRSR